MKTKKWYLGVSVGTLRGRSWISVGLVWTSSMVSFCMSNRCPHKHTHTNTQTHTHTHTNIHLAGCVGFLVLNFSICFPQPPKNRYQLDVVNSFLLKLLQSNVYVFLKREHQALHVVLPFIQAKLHGHLQRETNTTYHKDKRMETQSFVLFKSRQHQRDTNLRSGRRCT